MNSAETKHQNRSTRRDVPYTPPTGWLERLDNPAEQESSVRYRFPRRAKSSPIHGTASLVSVTRYQQHCPKAVGSSRLARERRGIEGP